MGIRIGADISVFEKSMKKVASVLSDTEAKMKQVGTKMTMAVTLPITGFATAAVKAFSDFDKAMTFSTAIMGDMTKQMDTDLRNLAITMSERSGTSATKLAEAYYFLASAGLDYKQVLGSLNTVNQFALAGQFDMAKATDMLVDAQVALGMSSKDAAVHSKNLLEISDAISLANIQANASIGQLAESLTNDAAVASRGFGMELKTMMAALSGYAAQGKKGAEAGSLLGRALRLISSSYTAHEKVFKKMGIQIVDSEGNYRNLIDIIIDMEKAFARLTLPERSAALEMLGFEALAQKSILPLLGMSDAMKAWEKNQESAAGKTDEIAGKMAKSFSHHIELMWISIVNLGIAIGGKLAPIVGYMSEIVRKSTEWWKEMNNEQQNFVLWAMAGAAAIGPIVLGLGFLAGLLSLGATLVATLASAFTAFVAISIPALVAIIGLLAVFAAAIPPIIGSLVGPASLENGFEMARMSALGFFKNVLGFSEESLNAVNRFMEGCKLAWTTIETTGTIAWEMLKLGLDSVVLGIIGTLNTLVMGFDKVVGHIKSLAGSMAKGLGGMLSQFPGMGDVGASMVNSGVEMQSAGQRGIDSTGSPILREFMSMQKANMNKSVGAIDAQLKKQENAAYNYDKLGKLPAAITQKAMLPPSPPPGLFDEEAKAEAIGAAVADTIDKKTKESGTMKSPSNFQSFTRNIDVAGMSSLAPDPQKKQQTEDKVSAELQRRILAKISAPTPVAIAG
jgi:TP901 family phage tail tape measure protein